LHGCFSFDSGPHCDEAAKKAELGATVIIFAIVVPVLVVVLCLVLLGIAMYQQQRQRQRPIAQQTPH
jgi:cell division protein FtsL